MTRKFMLRLALASALVFSAGVLSQTVWSQAQPGQQQQQAKQTKSVSGKVTSVAPGGRAFTMDVKAGNQDRTMQFVVDKRTQVQGHVTTGTQADVVYVSDQGQNVALNVAEARTQ